VLTLEHGAGQRNISMQNFLGKVRPQIFLALLLLGIISILAMRAGMNEISVGGIAGIIALAKDVLQSDA
jgi:hypothetical protein